MPRWLPELATVLRNSVKTGHTFVEKEAKVQALFSDVAGFSSTSKDFLEQNGSNIIRLSKQGQAQLPLLAKYAPEYPCLLQGDGQLGPPHGAGLPELHAAHQPRGAAELADRLHRRGHSRGTAPTTARTASMLPNPPYDQKVLNPQPPISAVDDGVSGGHGKFRPRSAPAVDPSSGYAGTASERSLVNAFAAPVMGVSEE